MLYLSCGGHAAYGHQRAAGDSIILQYHFPSSLGQLTQKVPCWQFSRSLSKGVSSLLSLHYQAVSTQMCTKSPGGLETLLSSDITWS